MSKPFMRNYQAMSDAKLRTAAAEFQNGYGAAVERVKSRGGSVEDNAAKCLYEARKRPAIRQLLNLDDDPLIVSGTVKTPPQFCPECERKKPFFLDDYICTNCREGVDAIDEEPEEEIAPAPNSSIDDIRSALAQGLATGKAPSPVTTVEPELKSKTRQYKRMTKPNLEKLISEMENELEKAYRALQEKQ